MDPKIRPREIIRQRNRRLKALTAALLVSVLAYGWYWWRYQRHWVGTDDAFVAAHVITLNSHTAGTVVEVNAENTQYVEAGQVLVRLNGARARLALQQAEAGLGEALRNLLALQAKSAVLRQRIAARQAALNRERHNLQRYAAAAGDGAVAQQKLQNTQDTIIELEAAIGEARAELLGIESQVGGVAATRHPTVKNAKNQLRRAYLDYHRRNILAPVSGYIAKRRVHAGDIIAAGAPLLAIVPLDDLWIDANFRETDIARLRSGQAAEIKIDAYGSELLYHGTVQGINPGTGSIFALLPPDNATGNFIHIVERVPVRIALNAEELRAHPLRPGLSALIRIATDTVDTPPLQSSVRTATAAYRTSVYEHELDEAEQLIETIIADNSRRAGNAGAQPD